MVTAYCKLTAFPPAPPATAAATVLPETAPPAPPSPPSPTMVELLSTVIVSPLVQPEPVSKAAVPVEEDETTALLTRVISAKPATYVPPLLLKIL